MKKLLAIIVLAVMLSGCIWGGTTVTYQMSTPVISHSYYYEGEDPLTYEEWLEFLGFGENEPEKVEESNI